MKTLDLPALWTAAGLTVRVLDGWDTPTAPAYVWRDTDPVCSMWHHTATYSYTPNRDKANVWAGLSIGGSTRLYSTGDGVPVLVVANAYPAPISSGYGQQHVIDLAATDTPNDLLAQGPDDSPLWAGNRSCWNTEIVLDGVGGHIDPGVWEMVVDAATIMHQYYGWTPARAIGHAQFTSRKIDLRDGRDPSTYETMRRFRNDMETSMEPDDWAKPSWDWAISNGLMSAQSVPHDPVDKQEMAVFFHRYWTKIDKTAGSHTHPVVVDIPGARITSNTGGNE